MGRSEKYGLSYYPFDIDFFQDLKIRKLIKYQGGKAVTVYALLLCLIYKGGYYMRWDEELPFIISEQTGFEEAYIQEVIKSCLALGLFSKETFDNHRILTSKGIQERYQSISKSIRRVTKMEEYNLISSEEKGISSEKSSISSEEKGISSEEKGISSEKTPISSEKTPISSDRIEENRKEIKENSTKVESKKVGNVRFLPPSLDEVKKYILEKGFSVDAENFVNFYESKGWFVGKNKMKNWKAAVATWEKREKEQPKKQPTQKPNIVNHDNRKTYHEF